MLLPGNVVRHVAGHDQVGKAKTQAVHHVIENHAPWTEVRGFLESPMQPVRLRELIEDADIVVNTTGNDAFTDALAMVAEAMEKPLVSGALYRGGTLRECSGRCWARILPSISGGRREISPHSWR